MSALGKNLPHDSAMTHVSGESQFIGDIPKIQNGLFVDVFLSTEAHAEILSIEINEDLSINYG